MRQHNFVWESVYELPFGPGRPFLRSGIASKIIGGWTLGNIWTWQTGAPITVGNVANTCNCFSELNQGVNLVPGASLGTHPANFDPSTKKWFNVNAFSAPAPYTFGNEGKGLLFAPHLFNINTTLSKRVNITERFTFEMRGEFFNTLNNVNFNGPNTTLGSSSFGTITSAGPPRQIQLHAALYF